MIVVEEKSIKQILALAWHPRNLFPERGAAAALIGPWARPSLSMVANLTAERETY